MAPHRNGNNGVTFQMRQRQYFEILTVSMISIEMIDFITSTTSTTSSLSATSAFRGGGVGAGIPGGAGAIPTDTTAPGTGMVTIALVMGRPATITDMATPLGLLRELLRRHELWK